jgi:hypothetical protein
MTTLSLLVSPSLKKRAPPTGGTLKEGERVKEPKEKGLLLHPPFAKVTSQAQQRP